MTPFFRKVVFFFIACVLFVAGFTESVLAEAPPSSELNSEILTADIEKLLSMEVTSASRIPEERRKVAAAVTVLTSEDIRRSGAKTIPDALRLVPGVEVARIDANKYAVSIRGFNDQNANKLLVMIDGRSIYNPLLSGTIWETKDIFLEDVDRIEIIRGPGGSSWGSNAVNGVINIITKNAKDTQGGLFVVGGGSEEHEFTNLRYGGKFGEDTYLRVYGKNYFRDQGYLPGGADDDSQAVMGGFRLDSGEKDSLFTLQGSANGGNFDGVVETNNVDSRDYVIQSQWERNFTKDSSLLISGYFARTEFESPLIGDDRNTGELNIQYSFRPIDRLQLLAGAQYRVSGDKITNSAIAALDPTRRTTQLESVYTKAKYDLIPEELQFSGGVRLQHSDFISVEAEPDISLSWAPNEEQTIWGSISRAVRTPSRLENDFLLNFPGVDVTFTGNKDLESEDLLSYQLGYRQAFSEKFFVDIAAFFNVYNDLIFGQGTTITNSGEGDLYGIEVAPSLKIGDRSIISAGYSLLIANLRSRPGAENDPITLASLNNAENGTPKQQAFGKASLSIAENWIFDFDLRYVSDLAAFQVGHYIVGDARLAWQASKTLELSIVGQNLFRAHHFEFNPSPSSEVQQGVYGQITVNF